MAKRLSATLRAVSSWSSATYCIAAPWARTVLCNSAVLRRCSFRTFAIAEMSGPIVSLISGFLAASSSQISVTASGPKGSSSMSCLGFPAHLPLWKLSPLPL